MVLRKLFVVETREGSDWVPITFWFAPVRVALWAHPGCRVRRVQSHIEADLLAEFISPLPGYLNFDWARADNYDWIWPR